MKHLYTIIALILCHLSYSQQTQSNSNTRKFIDNASFTQINEDWNQVVEFKFGSEEIVKFLPTEIINLKTNTKIKSLQMDMNDVIYKSDGEKYYYHKQSWIDIEDINNFIFFIEEYVIPNIKHKTDKKQSVTYIFNSKEIVFNFSIQKNRRSISIYVKDDGIINYDNYFRSFNQSENILKLLAVLKGFN